MWGLEGPLTTVPEAYFTRMLSTMYLSFSTASFAQSEPCAMKFKPGPFSGIGPAPHPLELSFPPSVAKMMRSADDVIRPKTFQFLVNETS
jgi:hypothetical protein